MNSKQIILAFLVVAILASGVAVFAQQVSVSDITFDVPANYSLNKTTDDVCVLKFNESENYTISVVCMKSSNPSIEKNSRIASDFEFISEDNYTSSNGIDINQQNFKKNQTYFSYYSFKVGNSSYMISYNFPVYDNSTSQDNPVMKIIESIK